MTMNRIAFSQKPAVDDAVTELKGQLGGSAPRFVIFFASPAYPPRAIAAAMQRAFAPGTVVGCTTAGEITSGAMLKGAVVAMALDTVDDAAVQILPGLRSGKVSLVPAFEGFKRHFRAAIADLDPERYVGLVLLDGMSGAEERVMDALGASTDLTFVGGSAGDDLAFRGTQVFANGEAHEDSAVLAVLRIDRGFGVLKTQSFERTGQLLVATRVRADERVVLEFDGRPAAEAYAEALGVKVEALEDKFMSRPLGLMVGDEPYVRSPQQVIGSAVKFYCAIEEGMELEVLRATNIVEATRLALKRQRESLGSLSGIVNFNCILRTLELERKAQSEAYGRLFADVPTVGFSTYGEAYLGHINQTATMLALR